MSDDLEATKMEAVLTYFKVTTGSFPEGASLAVYNFPLGSQNLTRCKYLFSTYI